MSRNELKAKYMFRSPYQNTGQNKDIRTTHKFSENVAEFKYLGMTVNIKITFMIKLKADETRTLPFNSE
jgi:hypothetical protein